MIGRLGKVVLSLALLLVFSGAMGATVNINTADAATLAQYINGVGPRRADAIISYRNTHGPFKNVQELTKVKGIGQKLVNQNKKRLVVSDTYSRAKNDSGRSVTIR